VSVARLVDSLGVPCLAGSTLVLVLVSTFGGVATVGAAGGVGPEDGLWVPSVTDAVGVEGGLRVFDVPVTIEKILR
jgi:hypothetical protein